MNFKGHLFLGIVGSVGLLAALFKAGIVLTSWQYVGIIALVLYFGLFPDLDTDSVAQNFTYSVLILTVAYLLYAKNYQLAAIIGFLSFIPIAAHHRGIMHSWLVGMSIAGAVAFFFGWLYGLAVIVGFAVHKIGDF